MTLRGNVRPIIEINNSAIRKVSEVRATFDMYKYYNNLFDIIKYKYSRLMFHCANYNEWWDLIGFCYSEWTIDPIIVNAIV